MPKIPDLNDLGARPIPTPTASVTPIDLTQSAKSGQLMGASIMKIGEDVAKVQDARERFNYSQAKSHFLRESIAAENSFAEDDDYATMENRYSEKMNEIRSEALKAVSGSKYKELLQGDLDLGLQRGLIDVRNLAKKREGDFGRSVLSETLVNNEKSLLQTSSESTRADLINSTNDAIDAALDNGYIDNESAVNQKRRVAENYATARISLLPPERQLQLISPRVGKSGDVSFTKKNDWTDAIPIDTKIKIYHNNQAEIKSSINDEVNQIEKAASLGLKVPPEHIKSLSYKARSAGLATVAQSLDRYGAVQDQANSFAVKSITQQQAEIAATAKSIESGNLKDVDKYAALTGVYKNKIEMLQSDPWQYYSAHGVVSQTNPIDVNNPMSIAENIKARRVDNEKVKNIEGAGFNLPLLNKSEIEQLKVISKTQTAEKTGTIIANLGKELRSEEKLAIASQLANDGDATVLASAMTMPTSQAKDIIAGNNIKGEASESKVRTSAISSLKGYVLNAETNESIQQPIYAMYKKLAFDVGNTDKEVDQDILNKAIENVVGKQIEVSPKFGSQTSKIFSYRDNKGKYVDENDLEDKFAAITDDTLRKVNGSLPMLPSGDQISADEMLKDTKFISSGNGRYIPYYEGLGMVTNARGQPYVLDMNKIDYYTNWGVPMTEDQAPTTSHMSNKTNLTDEAAYAKSLKTGKNNIDTSGGSTKTLKSVVGRTKDITVLR